MPYCCDSSGSYYFLSGVSLLIIPSKDAHSIPVNMALRYDPVFILFVQSVAGGDKSSFCVWGAFFIAAPSFNEGMNAAGFQENIDP